MKTILSEGNPYGADRYGFLWEKLRAQPGGRHLDYGAYDGSVIRTLVQTGAVSTAEGVDVNHSVVEANCALMPPGVELRHVGRGNPLPFPVGAIDSASLLDVIEHIADQESVLREVNRVLKPGGLLVITVPGKHLFSFLDTGNFKFRFPRIHRALYLRRHNEADYHHRYVDNPDGLIGDIEQGKAWHQHFSRAEMQSLLEGSGFRVQELDGSGFFTRLILPLRLISRGKLKKLWEHLLLLDARTFDRTNLFCLAVKDRDQSEADG